MWTSTTLQIIRKQKSKKILSIRLSVQFASPSVSQIILYRRSAAIAVCHVYVMSQYCTCIPK